ncbi:hypothetical protein GGH92_001178 [Coemansia sp. RSA 2673]|nr:hypothetical protein GGH92_001178 [Coemansia sp. RSA 2673]
MTEGMKGSIDSRDIAISNSLELAQLLRSMTPAATMSKVMWAGLSTRMEQHNEEVFGLFVDSLCSNTKGSMLDFGELLLRHPSTIDCISQLSVLKLSCRDSPNVHSSLVHKCANVLQYLDIGIHRAKALIYDVNDVPVVYPKLLHLQMYMAGLNDSSAPVFAPGIVPFPVLKSLQLQMGYPFGDDVMFRGNSATLEELEIRLSREMMAMLNNSQAFGKEYKNLKRVLVNELGHNGYQSLSSDDTVHKFIRSLANNACRMNLMCGGPNTCLVALTRHDDYCFEYIQELTLWRDRVSLYNMLCLLKALPILTRLTCSIGENGSEFDRISANDLPDHIAYTYSDTGMHLKTLRFPHSKDESKIANVNFIMLLALVCPNFRPVEILEGFMSYYYDSVVKATRSGPFSKYAPCLLRLFEGSKVINTRHSGHVKR